MLIPGSLVRARSPRSETSVIGALLPTGSPLLQKSVAIRAEIKVAGRGVPSRVRSDR